MKKLGLVGWRGMVGSVLMERMQQENDFAQFDVTFFTTSQAILLLPAKAVITRKVFIQIYAAAAGMVFGLMPRQRFEWKMTASLY